MKKSCWEVATGMLVKLNRKPLTRKERQDEEKKILRRRVSSMEKRKVLSRILTKRVCKRVDENVHPAVGQIEWHPSDHGTSG